MCVMWSRNCRQTKKCIARGLIRNHYNSKNNTRF